MVLDDGDEATVTLSDSGKADIYWNRKLIKQSNNDEKYKEI